MKIELDNAQNTPHIDVMDDNGIIQCQISFTRVDPLINGKPLWEYPKEDGIIIHDKGVTYYGLEK